MRRAGARCTVHGGCRRFKARGRCPEAVRCGVIRWLLVMGLGSKYVCIYIFSILVAS